MITHEEIRLARRLLDGISLINVPSGDTLSDPDPKPVTESNLLDCLHIAYVNRLAIRLTIKRYNRDGKAILAGSGRGAISFNALDVMVSEQYDNKLRLVTMRVDKQDLVLWLEDK